MKKFLIPALVLIMLLASSTSAYARGGGGGGDVVRLQGYIDEIDKDAQTFTLQVTSGSDYVGDVITVQVTHSTSIEYCDGLGNHVSKTFGDLKEGDRVGVTGIFKGDLLFAKVVVIH